MLTSPLLIVFLPLINNKIGFAEVLGQYLSHACSRAIWEGFMLRFHACAPDGVDVLSFDGWYVVVSGVRALKTLVIYIIPTGITVT
jgi:hypothetical protein